MKMFLRVGFGSLLLVGLALPGQAQPDAAGRCSALIQSVGLVKSSPAKVEFLGSDGCRFTGVTFGFGTRFGYQVGVLTEHGIPFGSVSVPTRPTAIRVEARDVVFALRSGQAKADWLNRQQQVPFDVVVDGRYDPSTHELRLIELSMEGRSIGRTSIELDAVDVDVKDMPGTTGVRSLALHMDSRRFIPAFVLAPLLPQLPEEDPGKAVEAGKTQVIAVIRSMLPQSGAASDTVDAITAFIAAFPHPDHVFDLSIEAAHPLTAAALAAADSDPAAAIALLHTLKITARYVGEAR